MCTTKHLSRFWHACRLKTSDWYPDFDFVSMEASCTFHKWTYKMLIPHGIWPRTIKGEKSHLHGTLLTSISETNRVSMANNCTQKSTTSNLYPLALYICKPAPSKQSTTTMAPTEHFLCPAEHGMLSGNVLFIRKRLTHLKKVNSSEKG